MKKNSYRGNSPSRPLVLLSIYVQERESKKNIQSNIYYNSIPIVQTVTAVQLHSVHPQTM